MKRTASLLLACSVVACNTTDDFSTPKKVVTVDGRAVVVAMKSSTTFDADLDTEGQLVPKGYSIGSDEPARRLLLIKAIEQATGCSVVASEMPFVLPLQAIVVCANGQPFGGFERRPPGTLTRP